MLLVLALCCLLPHTTAQGHTLKKLQASEINKMRGSARRAAEPHRACAAGGCAVAVCESLQGCHKSQPHTHSKQRRLRKFNDSNAVVSASSSQSQDCTMTVEQQQAAADSSCSVGRARVASSSARVASSSSQFCVLCARCPLCCALRAVAPPAPIVSSALSRAPLCRAPEHATRATRRMPPRAGIPSASQSPCLAPAPYRANNVSSLTRPSRRRASIVRWHRRV